MILTGVDMITPWEIPIVIAVSQQRLFTRPIFKPYKIMKNDNTQQNIAQQDLKNVLRSASHFIFTRVTIINNNNNSIRATQL